MKTIILLSLILNILQSPWKVWSDTHNGIEKYVLPTCSPFLVQIPIIFPRITEKSVTALLRKMSVGKWKLLQESLPLI